MAVASEVTKTWSFIGWMLAAAWIFLGPVPATAGDATREKADACQVIEVAATGGQTAAEDKKRYKCTCDSPCSGSITCDTGCYAFCEENPEKSGRHVCVKGCSSAERETPSPATWKFSSTTRFSTISLRMPERDALHLIQRLSAVDPAFVDGTGDAKSAGADRSIDITLTDVTLADILASLNRRHAASDAGRNLETAADHRALAAAILAGRGR